MRRPTEPIWPTLIPRLLWRLLHTHRVFTPIRILLCAPATSCMMNQKSDTMPDDCVCTLTKWLAVESTTPGERHQLLEVQAPESRPVARHFDTRTTRAANDIALESRYRALAQRSLQKCTELSCGPAQRHGPSRRWIFRGVIAIPYAPSLPCDISAVDMHTMEHGRGAAFMDPTWES
jgi:hypothetical protein